MLAQTILEELLHDAASTMICRYVGAIFFMQGHRRLAERTMTARLHSGALDTGEVAIPVKGMTNDFNDRFSTGASTGDSTRALKPQNRAAISKEGRVFRADTRTTPGTIQPGPGLIRVGGKPDGFDLAMFHARGPITFARDRLTIPTAAELKAVAQFRPAPLPRGEQEEVA